MKMIDVKLINRAFEKSEIIEKIDSSWREHVDSLKESIVTIPFKGEYEAVVKDDSIIVEGCAGSLLIDKVYYDHKTYLLKEPVKHSPFKICGVYDSKGYFKHFIAKPEIGFHYMGLSEEGYIVCTGDIEYADPDSIDALKAISEKIVTSFRLINMESLGTVFLPDAYQGLRDIFTNKETDSKMKFGMLMSGNLIEEIL